MYHSELYCGDAFLGTDEIGAGYGGIYNTNSYQNNPETVTLYWTFYPYGPAIHDMTWEIETDIVDTFDSDELRKYYSHNQGPAGPTGATGATGTYVESFIPANVHKGIAVPIFERLQSESRPMYWRVRGTYGDDISAWGSDVFNIPGAIDEAARSAALALLPDVLYNKTEGYVPGTGSNVFKIHDAIAQELELHNQYLTMTSNDAYIGTVRDEAIEAAFGVLTNIAKRYEMYMIDYREIVKSFMYNIRNSPSQQALSELVKSIYVNYPDYISIKEEFGMYLGSDTISDPDYVAPFCTGDTGLGNVYIWDARHLAYGTIVEVLNSMSNNDNLAIPRDYVFGIIRNMAPSHVPVFLRYK